MIYYNKYGLKIFIFIISCICIIYNLANIRGNIDDSSINIVGYIHICQKDEWKKSFDMLMESLKTHGLYKRSNKIRVGVVNGTGNKIEDERFNDPKLEIIHIGKDDAYERPTLLHMKNSCVTDPNGTLYYYLHTKGIRHFGTKHETSVTEWMKSMSYWNIELWKEVVDKLKTHETYGCHYNNVHYVGNFWWSTAEHVKKLSDKIPDYYTAPEDWILTNKDNMYCANNCGDDFKLPYDPEIYKS